MRWRRLLCPAALLTRWAGLAQARLKIQADGLGFDSESRDRAAAVVDAFKAGWATYKEHAWGHDEVTALSLNYSDSRNGWGASMVDALTTMQLMVLTDLYEDALKHLTNVDFTRTDNTVSFFETTIRYIGGMISAYELSARTDAILKTKAVQLADKLMLAWSNDSVLPFGYLNFTDNSIDLTERHNQTNLAEAGSMVLEYHKLTVHTDNTTYVEMAEEAMKAIMRNQAIHPGLHSVDLDPMDARPIGDLISWEGASDSYYEYLLKYALITGNKDPDYLEQWWLAVDSSIHHLLRRSAILSTSKQSYPNAKERYYLARSSDKLNATVYGMGHLGCFVGGNWMLGGKMLKNDTILNYGLQLVETCADSYSLMPTGIGPEEFYFVDKETMRLTGRGTLDMGFYEQTAIVPKGGYFSRPEVIESMFYAYRITGDKIWQDRAWAAFESMKAHCFTPESLCAPLTRVDRVPSHDFEKARGLQTDGSAGWEDGPEFREKPEYLDSVESFWWGETLKYLYLIFAPPSLVNLDETVLTTEAHPFRMDEAWHDSARPSLIPVPTPRSGLSGSLRTMFGVVFIAALLAGAVFVMLSPRRTAILLGGKRDNGTGNYEVVFDGEEEGAERRSRENQRLEESVENTPRLSSDGT